MQMRAPSLVLRSTGLAFCRRVSSRLASKEVLRSVPAGGVFGRFPCVWTTRPPSDRGQVETVDAALSRA